jgi:hypothetical protein
MAAGVEFKVRCLVASILYHILHIPIDGGVEYVCPAISRKSGRGCCALQEPVRMSQELRRTCGTNVTVSCVPPIEH